jgi:hypothetical protein
MTASERRSASQSDKVLWLVLSAFVLNVTEHAALEDVLRCPALNASRERLPLFPALAPDGLPSGHALALPEFQFTVRTLARAAGWPNITAHGEMVWGGRELGTEVSPITAWGCVLSTLSCVFVSSPVCRLWRFGCSPSAGVAGERGVERCWLCCVLSQRAPAPRVACRWPFGRGRRRDGRRDRGSRAPRRWARRADLRHRRVGPKLDDGLPLPARDRAPDDGRRPGARGRGRAPCGAAAGGCCCALPRWGGFGFRVLLVLLLRVCASVFWGGGCVGFRCSCIGCFVFVGFHTPLTCCFHQACQRPRVAAAAAAAAAGAAAQRAGRRELSARPGWMPSWTRPLRGRLQ